MVFGTIGKQDERIQTIRPAGAPGSDSGENATRRQVNQGDNNDAPDALLPSRRYVDAHEGCLRSISIIETRTT
ncbi:hypothetical protein BURCENBC7_AP7565 [Burkholderia cenocepacia BC7]|nr:hypothetical protein BURCENK562V_C6415 [Burkholderia cenocepacia K56-2Valvano]ERI32040.1 hypothetical protein BURCENBC7_AP7565 [Burkholderia cenocepacia BC7]SOT40036.1 conserved hypothetical protein [Burkholderia cenocepacia]